MPSTSALVELRAGGEFGSQGFLLLFSIARSEVQRFPELRPNRLLDDDDVWDLVQEFFADKGAIVTDHLLLEAVDEASMGRLLRTAVRHWMVDAVRKTGRGALRRRLEKVLADAPSQFEKVPSDQPGAGRWRLVGGGAPSTKSFELLVSAAWTVTDISIPTWSSHARRPPAADAASLRRVLEVVFTCAEGSVDIATLTGVFARRFPTALDPREQPLPDEHERTIAFAAPPSADPVAQVEAQEARAEARVTTRRIFDELTAQERSLVPVLDRPVTDQMTVTRVGRSQTYRHVAALKERLQSMLGPAEGRLEVMEELVVLCQASLPDEPMDGTSYQHGQDVYRGEGTR